MRTHRTFSYLAVAVAAMVSGWPAAWAEDEITFEELKGRIAFDPTPLQKAGMVTSYADMLEGVTVAVVTISSKRDQSAQMQELFDDPLFKRLFPDREAPESMPRMPNAIMPVTGSGVIISEDGYVLTNNHVVEESEGLEVHLTELNLHFEATLVAADPKSDVALIKINTDQTLPHIKIGDSAKLRVGDITFAIGNPFGLDQSVTMGIVSALGRSSSDVDIVDYADFIQTDAAINRGNSGGALIDAQGRLVGINTAIQGGATGGNLGIGFSIPSNMAIDIVQRLLDGGGVVRRGFLGVTLQPMEKNLAEALGWKNNYGVAISNVFEDTPAAVAGLKPNDIITSYRGERALSPDSLRLIISNTPPNERVTFGIFRAGEEMSISLELAELPDNPREFFAGSERSPNQPREFLEGVTIVNLDASNREEFGVAEEDQGVLVETVAPDSAAADAGLRPGHVILEVNQEPVTSVAEAVQARSNFAESVLLMRISAQGARSLIAVRVKP